MKEETSISVVPEGDMALLRRGLKGYCSSTHGDFDTVNLIVTLRRTVSELTNMLEAVTGDVRVTPGRINILMTLDSQPEKRLPLSELGEYLVVTRANITGLVDGLVKDGLVRRIDHPDDRRMVLAELTEKGKKFITWFAPRHQELVKRIGSCLSPDQKAKIVTWLDAMRTHLRDLPIERLDPFPD